MVLKDLINTSKHQNQRIILYSKKNKGSHKADYLGDIKAYSKLINYVGDLEVIEWGVDESGLLVYLLIPEDGGVEDGE